ncbi:peptidase inhibitor family I36 protein [Streptomyces sp. NPDC048718]|uniref:peptidase inhibitor family I36 protein n=1 Tax=Streptomyces sp. NPDC048718 TaxID=3365587 RepID=UPI003720A33A
MQSTALRRIATTAVALAALGAGALVTAGSASAATGKNGVLESGEMGFFCSSNQAGSVFDLYDGDGDFRDDRFVAGSCQGQPVYGNVSSVWNRDSMTWWVYTDLQAGGMEGSIPAGYVGNMSSTFKNQIIAAYSYKAR